MSQELLDFIFNLIQNPGISIDTKNEVYEYFIDYLVMLKLIGDE